MTEERPFRQAFPVKGGDFSRAGDVSCLIKNLLKEIGVPAPILRRLAIASYEAELNIIMYATEGTADLTVTPDEVRLVFNDRGPGIPDIALAMREGYSTATTAMRELGFGAGMGLPNIKKNADAFLLASEPGRGTRLEIAVRLNGKRP